MNNFCIKNYVTSLHVADSLTNIDCRSVDLPHPSPHKSVSGKRWIRQSPWRLVITATGFRPLKLLHALHHCDFFEWLQFIQGKQFFFITENLKILLFFYINYYRTNCSWIMSFGATGYVYHCASFYTITYLYKLNSNLKKISLSFLVNQQTNSASILMSLI